LKLASVLAVPLLLRGNLVGVLYLGNNRMAGLFNEESLRVAMLFGAQASLLIELALLGDELAQHPPSQAAARAALTFEGMVGNSPAMQEVFSAIERVAPLDIGVLITGETGTGKELVARALHARSNRARGPLVAINCGAIPEGLIESELFGHSRGAFTGAVATAPGKLLAANGGTIFLDEIGEMPPLLQVRLLRVLEEHAVTPVGETRAQPVDVRVIAATHAALAARVAQGEFREDLYYRLNVIPIEKIILPSKSRDELPPILAGLQWIWTHPTLKQAVFTLLIGKLQAGRKATGRPGMGRAATTTLMSSSSTSTAADPSSGPTWPDRRVPGRSGPGTPASIPPVR